MRSIFARKPALISSRLQGCQRDIEVWRRILHLRGLVLEAEDDVDSWIKLANQCRKSDRIELADESLKLLLNDDPSGLDKARQPGAVAFEIVASSNKFSGPSSRRVCHTKGHVGGKSKAGNLRFSSKVLCHPCERCWLARWRSQ